MPDETDNFKDWDGIYRDWTQIKVESSPKNKQIEREEVLNPCMTLCKQLKTAGIILKWRRLDASDVYHENGEPDLEIWIPSKDHSGAPSLFILLAECKKPDGGVHAPDQIAYQKKYVPFVNVQYELITSSEQLEYIIRKLSDIKVDMQDFLSFECKPSAVATDI